jgi:hypothetical protein
MVIFCLQVCPTDVTAAIELAQLISDIVPVPDKQSYEWLLAYRRDTPLNRVGMIQTILAKRFTKVSSYRAELHGEGWPAGANALWTSTMLFAARMQTSCQGILTFEADCVPVREDWMPVIMEAYKSRHKPVVGNLHQSAGLEDHINGNAIWPLKLLDHYPELRQTPAQHAWDYFHRKLLLSLAEDTPAIMQLYARKELSEGEWLGLQKHARRPALLHGIKDGSARQLARNALVLRKEGAKHPPNLMKGGLGMAVCTRSGTQIRTFQASPRALASVLSTAHRSIPVL